MNEQQKQKTNIATLPKEQGFKTKNLDLTHIPFSLMPLLPIKQKKMNYGKVIFLYYTSLFKKK